MNAHGDMKVWMQTDKILYDQEVCVQGTPQVLAEYFLVSFNRTGQSCLYIQTGKHQSCKHNMTTTSTI